MKYFVQQSIIGFLFCSIASVTAVACPLNLQSLKDRQGSQLDLCSLYDRYHDAVNSLKAKGVSSPDRMAGIYGPRFINFSTWQAKAPLNNYDPTSIYEPAPATWKYWSAGAEFIQTESDKNFSNGRINPISMDWLTTLHKTALNGLLVNVGQLRKNQDVGMTFKKAIAITESQVKNISNIEYPKVFSSGPLMSWVPTECYEDKSEQYKTANPINNIKFRFIDWPAIDISKTFVGDDGQRRQCGYIVYASVKEFEAQYNLWINFVISATWELTKENSTLDPIAVAAKAQRWFVAIHPYSDGNGRMSRYVMDYILKSLSLPAPILNDMDNDMFFSETQWAHEVAKGLEYSVNYVEMCAKDIHANGCNVVD